MVCGAILGFSQPEVGSVLRPSAAFAYVEPQERLLNNAKNNFIKKKNILKMLLRW